MPLYWKVKERTVIFYDVCTPCHAELILDILWEQCDCFRSILWSFMLLFVEVILLRKSSTFYFIEQTKSSEGQRSSTRWHSYQSISSFYCDIQNWHKISSSISPIENGLSVPYIQLFTPVTVSPKLSLNANGRVVAFFLENGQFYAGIGNPFSVPNQYTFDLSNTCP